MKENINTEGFMSLREMAEKYQISETACKNRVVAYNVVPIEYCGIKFYDNDEVAQMFKAHPIQYKRTGKHPRKCKSGFAGKRWVSMRDICREYDLCESSVYERFNRYEVGKKQINGRLMLYRADDVRQMFIEKPVNRRQQELSLKAVAEYKNKKESTSEQITNIDIDEHIKSIARINGHIEIWTDMQLKAELERRGWNVRCTRTKTEEL